jgi:hypothetical protein
VNVARRRKAEIFERQRAQMIENRRLRRAIDIQRVWRGYRMRRAVQPFIDERRTFLKVLYVL